MGLKTEADGTCGGAAVVRTMTPTEDTNSTPLTRVQTEMAEWPLRCPRGPCTGYGCHVPP